MKICTRCSRILNARIRELRKDKREQRIPEEFAQTQIKALKNLAEMDI
jgi:hypothetical protein